MTKCSPELRLLALVLLLCCGFATGASVCTAAEIADEPNSDKPLLALDTGGHTNAVYKLMVSDYSRQRYLLYVLTAPSRSSKGLKFLGII